MEYKVLKEISLLTLAQAGPKGCKEFSVEYTKLTLKMRHHDSAVGTWVIISNHDHESHTHFKSFIKWAKEDPKRIAWLIEKGFIEKVEPPFKPVTITLTSQEMVDKAFALLNFAPILYAIGDSTGDPLWKVWEAQLSPHTQDTDCYHRKLDKAWEARK